MHNSVSVLAVLRTTLWDWGLEGSWTEWNQLWESQMEFKEGCKCLNIQLSLDGSGFGKPQLLF